MPNFVDDNTSLPFPKFDLGSLAGDPSKGLDATEWNTVCQALLDVRARIPFPHSGDPNGAVSGVAGDLVRDTQGQLWLNVTTPAGTPGTLWTPMVRGDGQTASNATAFAWFGDSNTIGEGATTDNAVRWNNVASGSSAVPIASVVFNEIYSNASSEPLTLVDKGTTDLQVANVSSFPGFSQELSAGQALFDLLNGVGTTPTAGNKPWFIKNGVSGVELKQCLPGSTFGLATPGFGGLNYYNYFKTRTLALLATAGRKLGGIFITLGGNDGVNSTDAGNVAANLNTLVAQLRTDFGPQLAVVFVRLNVHVDGSITFASTVISQQNLAATQIVNSKMMVIDTYPMASDNLHYKADPVWDMGLQYLEAMRRLRGMMARRVTQPTLIGWGTPSYNNAAGALTPRGYNLSIHGDLELCFIAAMKNSSTATASSTWTASGWTLSASGAQAIGGQTQEWALFSRAVLQSDLDGNSGMPATFSCTTGNDENYSVRVTVRGPNLFPSIDGSITSYAATTFGTTGINAGGVTTTGVNDLVLTFIAGQGGGASLTEHMAVSNGTTNPVVIIDAPLIQNTTNYGLLAVVAGVKSAAGATGTTVVTPSITTNPTGCTVALKA